MNPAQRNTIILLGSMGLGLILVFFFVILPFQGKLAEQRVTIEQERIRSEIAALQAQNLQATEREYERLKTTSASFDGFFVSDETVLQFISALESVANQTGVTQNIQNLQTPVSGKGTSTFDIELGGSFRSLLSYLSALEQQSYYVSVDQLDFRSGEDGTNMRVTLKVHIQWRSK